jgi:predicted permease
MDRKRPDLLKADRMKPGWFEPGTWALKSRVKGAMAARGHALDDDIIEELASHAVTAFETARADGAEPAEADRRVDALIAQWCSEAPMLRRRPRRPPIIDAPAVETRIGSGLAQDLGYGLRVLRRAPGFATVAILTMALGIGATTTLFSVTYGVLLKPLPWADAERLVRLSESRAGHNPRIPGTITNGTFIAWREGPSTVEDIGGWRGDVRATAVIGAGDPLSLQTAAVTPSLFGVLKARPLRGRLFVEDDAVSGENPRSNDLILLSYGLWQERYGGRDDAIGSVVRLDDKSMTVVGVMPRDFVFPDPGTRAWTPWAVPSVIGKHDGRTFSRIVIFRGIARLRSGATPDQASAEGTSRARSAPDPGNAAVAMFGANGPASIRAVPAIEMMTAEVRPALVVLLGAVVLLLATATANVASLQLARAAARRREMAIRAAIGAGAGRLTQQLLVESSLIGCAGGLAGLALAAALHRALPSLLPADFPRVDAITIDMRVLSFTVAVSLLSSIAFGLLPALHAKRVNLIELLADAGGAPTGAGLQTPTARARTTIMVGQLAITCVLLVGAALLGRSFLALMSADRGYDPRDLLTATIPLPSGYSVERRVQLLEATIDRLRSMPGVTETAFSNALPLLSTGGWRPLRIPSPADPSIQVEGNTIQRVVSPGYFKALGIRFVAGRRFTDADTMTSPMVAVVNRSFAARYLPQNPIGAVVPNFGLCRGDNDRWEVVGIVDDVRQGGLEEPLQPEIFMPHRQVGCAASLATPIVVIRTAGDPARHAPALRAAVREEDAALAVDSVMTMEDRVMTSLAKPQLYAVVLIGFGGIALVLGGIGLFGVLSYTVAHRTREIGVRTALGARTADIVALVVRQAVVISACGAAAGLWLAYVLARYVSGFLYGVTPHDALTYVSVPLVLLVVAVMACVVPARRAARVDPLQALRSP